MLLPSIVGEVTVADDHAVVIYLLLRLPKVQLIFKHMQYTNCCNWELEKLYGKPDPWQGREKLTTEFCKSSICKLFKIFGLFLHATSDGCYKPQL